MSLARRIRDCRYAKGWGPDELAGRANISRTALYQIESGKTETPRAGTLRRIATALGVTTEALLGHEAIPYASLHVESEPEPAEPEVVPVRGRTLETIEASSIPPLQILAARGRTVDLDHKFHALLDSPLGESLAKIVEESYRLLPSLRVGVHGYRPLDS